MKRKGVTLFLFLALIASLFACGSLESNSENNNAIDEIGPIDIGSTKDDDLDSSSNISTTNYIYEQTRNDENEVKVWGEMSATDDEIKAINALIQNYGKDVSFKVVSVDGGSCLSYNSKEEFFAASTIKAAYVLYCYMQMESGNGALSDEMVYTSDFYQTGSGSIKNSPSGTVYLAKDVLHKVMQESDNSGYLMCVKKWGKDGYNSFVESIGCERLKFISGNVWGDQVRAEDFIIVWNEIYQYFQRETALSKEFYNSCISPKVNFFGDSLSGSIAAQKYGISVTKDVYCNTAIVYGENDTYFLSVFTESKGESDDIQFAKALVRKIHAIMN